MFGKNSMDKSMDWRKVRDFLEENNVHQGWKDKILESEHNVKQLSDCLGKLDQLGTPYCPERSRILYALSFHPPEEVKAIIVGHDPHPSKATGLAFSCNSYVKAIERMKEALRRAGIENRNNIDHYDYTHWARHGILLLNAVLTVTRDVTLASEKQSHEHWKDFTAIIIQIAQSCSNHSGKLHGMFWGDFAKDVYGLVDGNNHCLFQAYHHPTWPPTEGPYAAENNFLEKASDQFIEMQHIFEPLYHTGSPVKDGEAVDDADVTG